MLKELKGVNFIFGFLYSLCIVLGFECEYFGSINVKSPIGWIAFVILFAVATLFSAVMYNLINEWKKAKAYDSPVENSNGKHSFLIYLGIIWICHFIVFLGVFPGFFVYDAQYELTETITRTFTDQQPILHVLAMGGIIQAIHKLTDNYNISIAAFILFQMTLVDVVFAYLLTNLRDKGRLTKKTGIVFSIYLGIFPVVVMYSLCSAKDGLFGAMLILIYLFFEKFFSKEKPYVLVAALTLMMLLRSNGIYALAVFAALLLLVYRKSGQIKRVMLILLAAMILYLGLNTAMLRIVNAQKWGSKEILTVPISQLARVYAFDNGALSEDEKTEIKRYIPEVNLLSYNPKTTDMVKIGFKEEEFSKDKAGFFKIWAKVGAENPVAYLNALCMTSYGLWYPNATIDGYKGNNVFTFVYGDSSYFGYETEEPGFRHSYIPVIDKIYRWLSLDVTIQRIPIVRYLFSPGFLLWAMLFITGYFVYTKDYDSAISFALPIIVIMTSFIGPMSLVRYSWYLWIFVPLGALRMMDSDRA